MLEQREKGEQCGVMGTVRDLIFIESEMESKAISKFLGELVDAIVVTDVSVALDYYEKYKNSDERFQVLIIPTAPVHSSKAFKLPAGCPTNGFIDFAVNRCQLRRKQDHLRDTLLVHIFQSAVMVDTMADALAIRAHLIKIKKEINAYIVIRDLDIIHKGMLPVGGRKGDAVAALGQLSLPELPMFQWLTSSVKQLEQAITAHRKAQEDAAVVTKSHHAAHTQIATLDARAHELQLQLHTIDESLRHNSS
eukprot:TRINITY_DN27165_c0_g2_i1.p1 TRINITY_DN27165_c0_g2~~TRINITY_DN27165_c0_g2_i1.p1  ORF type:complete len:291 (-),score=91.73 TRINITY_DN27165_c0_g2_i1:81-830(-)